MTLKKRGLGRGLEALLANVSTQVDEHTSPSGSLQEECQTMPDDMGSDGLLEFANAITASGTHESAVIQKIGHDSYEVVFGESRWRAARLTGLQEMNINCKELDDREALTMALIETIQKENLNLLQEAKGLRILIDEFEAMLHKF